MNSNEKIVEKAIKDGRLVADKIRNAKTLDEVKELSSEIEEYSNFVNKNFGVPDDFGEDGEKYCELTFYIHMAAEIKNDYLYRYAGNPSMGNEGVDDFDSYLESREWLQAAKNAEF